jgi:DNA segregation ATPase FtsK/SpoIIIE-like protein
MCPGRELRQGSVAAYPTASNSSVILDQTGAEYLIGHGDMLVGGSVPLQRRQESLVTRTEIDTAMQR